MGNDIFESILGARKQIARRMQAEIGAARKVGALTVTPARAQNSVPQLKARIEETRAAKDAAARRFDLEIGRLQTQLEQLESRVREQQREAKVAKEPRAQKTQKK